MPTLEFESRIKAAIDEGIIPGAVLFVRSKDGKIDHSSAHGGSPPSALDSIFTLASMTKLLTGVSVLQLLEKQQQFTGSGPDSSTPAPPITLETDVSPYLPELASQPVLVGFTNESDGSTGESSPILRPRTKPILLRHLLTHSSGCGYPFLDEKLAKYFEHSRRDMMVPLSPAGGRTVIERYGYPLLFEPGEGWAYGCGLDWAGLLLKRVSGGKGLEEWIKDEILSKLDVDNDNGAPAITFYPQRFDEDVMKKRRAGMSIRNEKTGRVEDLPGFGRMSNEKEKELEMEEMGGESGYADLSVYIKVLESLMKDDGKLLKPESARLLFEGLLLEDKARQALKDNVKNPGWIVGWVPDNGGEYDWGVGGLVTTGDQETSQAGGVDGGKGRRKGFVQWGGVFNLSWFIDRTAGVTGIFGTQILHGADPLVRPLWKEFEEEIYKLL